MGKPQAFVDLEPLVRWKRGQVAALCPGRSLVQPHGVTRSMESRQRCCQIEVTKQPGEGHRRRNGPLRVPILDMSAVAASHDVEAGKPLRDMTAGLVVG